MADKIEIPEPHSGLPATIQKKWKAAYEAAFKEAQNDFPDDIVTQKQAALRDANKVLRVEDPDGYEAAMKLEDWQFIHRKTSTDGKMLNLVTRHGKKFSFPIPASKQAASKD